MNEAILETLAQSRGLTLLVGGRGQGKTTLLTRLAALMHTQGSKVGGILCPGMFDEAGQKVATDWLQAPKGQPRRLARVFDEQFRLAPGTRPVPVCTNSEYLRYGKWEFSLAELAAADTQLAQTLTTSTSVPDIVLVDEIGPLELHHGLGFVRALAVLDELGIQGVCEPSMSTPAKQTPRSVIVALRPDLVEEAKARWPKARFVAMA